MCVPEGGVNFSTQDFVTEVPVSALMCSEGEVNFSTQDFVTEVRVFGSYLSEDIFDSENQLYG